MITRAYAGREVTILAVLNGSLVFLADLVRHMPLLMRLDVVTVSSYPGKATRSQGPKLRMPADLDLRGRHVLIVDDVLDTGRTLRALYGALEAMAPASLATCVLLRKQRSQGPPAVQADFVGFEIGEAFVVGYGLDYAERYRNLPDIRILDPIPDLP